METKKEISCKNCNCEIPIKRNRDLTRKKYCSDKCKYEGMSKAYNGRIFSEEHKQHLRENHRLKRGYKPTWLGKKMPKELVEKLAATNRIVQKGKKLSQEHKDKIKEWNNLHNVWKGRKHSEETKNKLRLSRLGKTTWIHKKHHSQESIQKIKDKRREQKNVYTTKIETKIQNFLDEMNIEFFTHHYMHIEHGYQCDILIPSMNLVIECDGDYWHKYPIGTEIDHIRTSELIIKGFKVLRLWECEIKTMDLSSFKNQLNIKGGK